MKTGERIRLARLRAGLTQIQLAARIGVTPLTIRNYEQSRTSPTIDRLTEIAAVLRVPLGAFHPELALAAEAAA